MHVRECVSLGAVASSEDPLDPPAILLVFDVMIVAIFARGVSFVRRIAAGQERVFVFVVFIVHIVLWNS